MPFVFKFSILLVIAALVAGQSWQHLDAEPGWTETLYDIFGGCTDAEAAAVIETKGDVIRAIDGTFRRLLGSAIGLNEGCSA